MQDIIPVPLEDELQSSFIDYAMSVIISRAIPDARDGLKPVQRRILYAMHNLKNFHDQPTKKSARIVGEVMGKFHPHGDMAIYDALTRLAQNFSTNHLLVEGQGNMGSVDGDPPAAQRYTEVRLTRLAEELLDDIDKDTVEFAPNFDDTEKEPLILPSKVPNLLVNGATGIAVGVATSIPPHNLGEVCDAVLLRLSKENCTVDDVLGAIKGPDFPTGGIAVMSQNALNGYRYGRGQLTVKAKAEIEDKHRRIIVTEIPYNVNKSNLMQTMAQLARDKKITGLRDIRDESDKKGIRIVIDYKDEGSGEQILNMLYKHTQLQTTFPLINLAVIGKSLKSLNVLQLVDTFLDHRRDFVLRRTKYELNVAQSRLHIVEGLLIAIDSIDQIIAAIKASAEISEARSKLMSGFKLTEKQSNAILDMKLSRLTHLENRSLNDEKKALEEKVSYYNKVISNSAEIDGIIKQEMEDIKKRFARPRRTEIIFSNEDYEITNEDMITNEKVTVILTNAGYVKRLALSSYKEQGRGGRGIISINLKEGDFAKQILTCNNKDFIICLTNVGRAYWIKAYNVPESGRYSEGKAIVNLVDTKEEKIIKILNINEFTASKLAFLTRNGLVKKVKAALFSRPRSNGVRAINLNTGDQIADVIMYSNEKNLIISTKEGQAIKFDENDLRYIGRNAMGVRGIRLKGDDRANNIIAANESGSILTVTENGYGKITDVAEYRLQSRGGSGVINLKVNEKTGPVQKCLFLSGDDRLVLINSLGVSITFPTSEIRVTGRAASGVRLMHLSPGQKIADAMLLGQEHAEQN
jgi:DNA gyrase subunit A